MDDTIASAGDRPSNGKCLQDFKGKVLSEAMNPDGCEFLKQKLLEMNPEDIQMIYSEVKYNASLLMMDRVGNNVIQMLFAVCDDEQMDEMVFSLTLDAGLLLAICLDSQGSQSMLKLIDCLTTWRLVLGFVLPLKEITLQLATHPIGSNVIRGCFLAFEAYSEPILEKLAENFLPIALNETGSALLQDMVKKDITVWAQNRLVASILLHIKVLSKDQFGSLLVKHFIGLELEHLPTYLIENLNDQFVCMVMDEYACSVVKKLMVLSEETQRLEIINSIINNPYFPHVLQNPYVYSFLQFAKECSRGSVRQSLNHRIQCHNQLRGQCPETNALPNMKRKRNHGLLLKNRLLLSKRRKRNLV
ncbi:pumilio homolog 12-like [Henckelia pumila]|uniref:pumilio homolog 12-like n=1 Tax=Henckelia pumila TaxID=405737 RepID=UPI003C6E17A5